MGKGRWSESLAEKWKDRNVQHQVDKLQRVYNRSNIVAIAFTAGGAGMMTATANPRIIAFGLFLAITGMVNIVLLKTWAHVRLSMLRVIWELQENRGDHSG